MGNMAGSTKTNAGAAAVQGQETPYTLLQPVTCEKFLENVDHAGGANVAPDDGNAGQRLTGTFEMLEAILLLLEPMQILVLQRVNSCFRSTIANSPPLRRKLFLEDVPSTQASATPVIGHPYHSGFARPDPVRLSIFFHSSSERFTFSNSPGTYHVAVKSFSEFGPHPWLDLTLDVDEDVPAETGVLDQEGSLLDTYLMQPSTGCVPWNVNVFRTMRNWRDEYGSLCDGKRIVHFRYSGAALQGCITVRQLL